MTKTIIGAALAFALMCVSVAPLALAYGDAPSLDNLLDQKELAHKAVLDARAHPGAGSGTPYFAADGVLGASAISAMVFGGIAATFFLMGRHGRYVAVGRG
ncbi:MAG: hypothetical protein EPO63_02890 [Candidatus Nitrosotenuis sp.]|nr:MAG: hypothetical protein EPO63_02890 [Candidatus Nitrosotenuis sp.]